MSGPVGESVARSDGRAKVTGQARYAIDVEEARLLHAKLLRSPVASARIVRLDTARAAALPGVEAIVTAADAPAIAGWVVAIRTPHADHPHLRCSSSCRTSFRVAEL